MSIMTKEEKEEPNKPLARTGQKRSNVYLRTVRPNITVVDASSIALFCNSASTTVHSAAHTSAIFKFHAFHLLMHALTVITVSLR